MSTEASGRTYSDAINRLNSLQSNAAVIEHIRQSGGKGGDLQLLETVEYLTRIGYKPVDLNRLNVIHITGTKGKGSTSAFTDSILRTLAPNARTGLYTSPHMVAVRERIRINGKPIPEPMFAKYFFQVWDKLEHNTTRANPDTPLMPAYFRYLTIMAFHVFLQEKVDATILEVGVGGTYDSTNIVPEPITTGITSLGIDHVFVLGKTLPEIAAQKGGIYKPGVPALAITQAAEGFDVLEARAKELGASSFTPIPEHPELQSRQIKLGLAGDHQRINASLAIGLVRSFLASPRLPQAFHSIALPAAAAVEVQLSSAAGMLPELPMDVVAPVPLPTEFVTGLEQTRWPGRCQVERDPRTATSTTSATRPLTWYLDGAHTVESLKCCGEWFGAEVLVQGGEAQNRDVGYEGSSVVSSGTVKSRTRRALIFNCTSGRSGHALLGTLVGALRTVSLQNGVKEVAPFHHVIFCTNTTYASGDSKGDLTSNAVDPTALSNLTTQHELATAWADLGATSLPTEAAQVHVLASIEAAVDLVRREAVEAVLVTGSLHLVGGVLEVAGLPVS